MAAWDPHPRAVRGLAGGHPSTGQKTRACLLAPSQWRPLTFHGPSIHQHGLWAWVLCLPHGLPTQRPTRPMPAALQPQGGRGLASGSKPGSGIWSSGVAAGGQWRVVVPTNVGGGAARRSRPHCSRGRRGPWPRPRPKQRGPRSWRPRTEPGGRSMPVAPWLRQLQ